MPYIIECLVSLYNRARENETPTMCGLAANNDNKVYGKHGNYDLTIIILWNIHYDLNFNVGLSDDCKK